MRRIKKAPFTLLEISISVALLALVATLVGWHLKGLLDTHRFHQHVDLLLTDLRKSQILALTHETDITLSLKMEPNGKWSYLLKSDEPLPALKLNRPIELSAVARIAPAKTLELHITPSGTIDPPITLDLFRSVEGEEGVRLDLSHPPQIQLYKLPH